MGDKYKPHVFVFPEDSANQSIANGFERGVGVAQRAMTVMPAAGGWPRVRDKFAREIAPQLRKRPLQYVVLMVDFDEEEDRRAQVLGDVDPAIADRVFVVGCWSEPEDLRRELGSFETIGALLHKDCVDGTATTWGHPLLKHNAAELARLNQSVRRIILPDA